MGKIFNTKPFVNKKNKQISITLPKKRLELKGRIPTKLRVEVLEWRQSKKLGSK